jgi:prophage antirepressor-like protein
VVALDGEPWFVAADVCKALDFHVTSRGQVNVTMATRNLGADEVGFKMIETAPGTFKPATSFKLISESGLYKLITRSNKPVAKQLQEWVTRVVLPSIRKDGGYISGEEKVVTGEMSEDELILKALTVLKTKVDRLTAERDVLAAEGRAINGMGSVTAHPAL